MTDRAVVTEVRARTDLVELVGQYVPLRRAGLNYIARCPFHDEKTPSFNVSPEKGLYFCFGCKVSGDGIRFYQEMEGVGFPEALRVLAERAGVELPENRTPEQISEDRRQRDLSERLHAVCESAASFFERSLRESAFSELARGALEERGISAELCAQFRLGYAPAQWDALSLHLSHLKLSPADAELAGLLVPGKHRGHYDRFRHRLMFPVFDRAGRIVAFSGRILPMSEEIPEGIVPEDTGKYMNSPETPLYKKSEILFGLANARGSIRQRQEAIVVEGNFDVVQMHQHGFTTAVAPLGTSFTEAQAALLRRFAETVVLVFDGDEAGRKAARACHALCAKTGLVARVGVLPAKMDPDSFLRSTDPQHGPLAMADRVKHGIGIVEWLIRDGACTPNYPETTPERVAVMRSLAPVIAAVRDPIERGMYVKQAAALLVLEEPQARAILKEHFREQVEAITRDDDDARKRPGLSAPRYAPEDFSPAAIQHAEASAMESLLLCPELFESADATALMDTLGAGFLPFFRAARGQWLEGRRLDGPELLSLAPTDKARAWLGARLVSSPNVEEKGFLERNAQALRDGVTKLKVSVAKAEARGLKHTSARQGLNGDPAKELGTLNDQLALKRELARLGARKVSDK